MSDSNEDIQRWAAEPANPKDWGVREQKHTPEPWVVERPSSRVGWTVWAPFSETSSIQVAETGYAITFDQANASRIVACVNACAGMDDPATEIERLRADRAALVEALQDVDSQFSEYEEDGKRYSGCSIYLKIGKVREAIAQHGGQP